jgi:hypothetical protein
MTSYKITFLRFAAAKTSDLTKWKEGCRSCWEFENLERYEGNRFFSHANKYQAMTAADAVSEAMHACG